MKTISINIVHTPGYGYELVENEVLLRQLEVLAAQEFIFVRVLVNGCPDNGDLEGYLEALGDRYPNFEFISSANRVKLGTARQILFDTDHTDYYFPFDEDDEFGANYLSMFFDINVWFELGPGSELLYVKVGESYEEGVISNCYPDWINEINLKRDCKGFFIEGVDYLVNSCFINRKKFPDLKWTDTNLCEDLNLHLEFFKRQAFVDYYPGMLVIYRADRSKMSVDKDPEYEDRVKLQDLTPIMIGNIVKEIPDPKLRFEHDKFKELWQSLQ